MRRGNIIVLLVAIVVGGIAAFMARSLLQPQPVAQPAPPIEAPTTIVVAAAPLAFGTVLTKDNANLVTRRTILATAINDQEYVALDDIA